MYMEEYILSLRTKDNIFHFENIKKSQHNQTAFKTDLPPPPILSFFAFFLPSFPFFPSFLLPFCLSFSLFFRMNFLYAESLS